MGRKTRIDDSQIFQTFHLRCRRPTLWSALLHQVPPAKTSSMEINNTVSMWPSLASLLELSFNFFFFFPPPDLYANLRVPARSSNCVADHKESILLDCFGHQRLAQTIPGVLGELTKSQSICLCFRGKEFPWTCLEWIRLVATTAMPERCNFLP